ncbi:MAG TPA: AraC family transcriptional regulator [Actinospica sp.]|nr:AraC family transcriptional regulator [Actinospica sp.]
MDVLTEALASMRTDRPVSVRTNGRAPWGLRLPPGDGAGFHVVLHGHCWLIPSRGAAPAAPVHLETGDVVFLRSGPELVLADEPGTPATPAGAEYFQDDGLTGVFGIGGGGALTSVLCGSYRLDQERPHPLVGRLPELIHLHTGNGRHPQLTSAVELLRAELDDLRIGASGIVPALIDSLLIYILRAWMDDAPAGRVGWAAALKDPAIAPALAAMHADPADAWTVESLAARAGLSRAAFAKKFNTMVGEPPLTYLTRWRMTTAARLLRESDAPLAAIAAKTGYGSEFAFAKAFKREYGQAPGGFRRRRPARAAAGSGAAPAAA